MWTEITRAKYARAGLRYASDMTDAEWALIEPFLPPAKRGGRLRTTVLRDVVNALLYLLRGGCPCPRGRQAGGQSKRWCHRQPIGQDHGKRRSARL